MSESLRPGFPLRINSNLYNENRQLPPEPQKSPVPEPEESEYMLRWGEHNSQVINIFNQLCQVSSNLKNIMAVIIQQCLYLSGKPTDGCHTVDRDSVIPGTQANSISMQPILSKPIHQQSMQASNCVFPRHIRRSNEAIDGIHV